MADRPGADDFLPLVEDMGPGDDLALKLWSEARFDGGLMVVHARLLEWHQQRGTRGAEKIAHLQAVISGYLAEGFSTAEVVDRLRCQEAQGRGDALGTRTDLPGRALEGRRQGWPPADTASAAAGSMSDNFARRETVAQRRRERLEEIAAQIKSGELVIRQATAEERRHWQATARSAPAGGSWPRPGQARNPLRTFGRTNPNLNPNTPRSETERAMPASSDPAKREVQRRNLKQYSENSRTHGAHSEAKLQPLREQYEAEQRAAFPSAGEDEIAVQAGRLAQMHLLQSYLEDRGLIADRRRGVTFPAAQLLVTISAAYERRRDQLAERERASTQPESKIAQWRTQLPGGGDVNAVDWVESNWVVPETGKLVVLQPWQKAALMAMFPPDGSASPWETFLISTVKKGGKTETDAMAMMYAVVTTPGEVAMVVANDEVQARDRVFDRIARQCRACRVLSAAARRL